MSAPTGDGSKREMTDHEKTMSNPVVQAIHQGQKDFFNHPITSAAIHTMAFVATGGIEGLASLGSLAMNGLRATKGVSQGTNLVYQGFDKAGVVRYVGITERAAAVRFGEHLSSGTAKSLLRYDVVPGATNLSRINARAWEQTLINQYGLGKNGGQLLNQINSIAPKNWLQYGIK